MNISVKIDVTATKTSRIRLQEPSEVRRVDSMSAIIQSQFRQVLPAREEEAVIVSRGCNDISAAVPKSRRAEMEANGVASVFLDI